MRRKHLNNAIKTLCEPKTAIQQKKGELDEDEENSVPTKEEQQIEVKKLIEMSNLSPQIQPDQLTVSQWCDLAKSYHDWTTTLPHESPSFIAYQQFLDNLSKKRNKYDSQFF